MAEVTFIGLGNMGLPMAMNLLKSGHSVTGFDLAEDQEPAIEKTPEQVFLEGEVCTMEDGCLSCGS
jgi:3-hydroxyisobutyrate dehydrogenase-like beta-hydroxyacid dehydrogenase